MTEELTQVVDALRELCEEATVPKNVKSRFVEIVGSLEQTKEVSIKVNKALHDLDEIGDDTNLQPYIRTQIWNISSMLEKLGSNSR